MVNKSRNKINKEELLILEFLMKKFIPLFIYHFILIERVLADLDEWVSLRKVLKIQPSAEHTSISLLLSRKYDHITGLLFLNVIKSRLPSWLNTKYLLITFNIWLHATCYPSGHLRTTSEFCQLKCY